MNFKLLYFFTEYIENGKVHTENDNPSSETMQLKNLEKITIMPK